MKRKWMMMITITDNPSTHFGVIKSLIDIAFKAIPMLDFTKSTMELETFIIQSQEYHDIAIENKFYTTAQVMGTIRTKFTDKTLRLFAEWKKEKMGRNFYKFSDLTSFISSQKNFEFDAADAKDQLFRQNQYKLNLSVREFWDHLKEIEARIHEKD